MPKKFRYFELMNSMRPSEASPESVGFSIGEAVQRALDPKVFAKEGSIG